MPSSIAAQAELLNVEAVEAAEELWIRAEATVPVESDFLPDALLSLADEERFSIVSKYDTAHPADFAADDEEGECGFLQWWFLARRQQPVLAFPPLTSQESAMSNSKPKKVPNFQPGDALFDLRTKTAGRVTAKGGGLFTDGSVWSPKELERGWGNGLCWTPRNRGGRTEQG